MKYNPEYHHRQSIRLRGYDYSQSGAYFVTICTYKKQCWFGEIRNSKMILNQIGKIVAQEWLKSSEIRQEIELDQWVIMPNHLHGIVIIHNDLKIGDHEDKCDRNIVDDKGASLAPLQRKPRSLSSFIVGFKSSVTKSSPKMAISSRKTRK